MASVLVVYATVYGSTREVAEAVATNLRKHDIQVDVQAAGDVRSVDGYSAVVVGGALYFFRWHRNARKFLSRNRATLKTMPVAIFGMGPFNNDAEEYAGARAQLDKALAKQSWLKPTTVEVFGGKFDPAGLHFPHNNAAMKKIPASDIRDWDAIDAWANTLPEAFGLH